MSHHIKSKYEEYHDPDYFSNVEKDKVIDEKDRISKCITIFEREFDNELKRLENNLTLVQSKIYTVKQQLKYLRYAIIRSFYDTSIEFNENDEDELLPNLIDNYFIKNLHPAIKKIYSEINNEKLDHGSSRLMRDAARVAVNFIHEKIHETKHKKQIENLDKSNTIVKQDNNTKNILKSPCVYQINKRNKCYRKIRLTISNSSRYLVNENEEYGATHKWHVFIESKSFIKLNYILEKVIYVLHPSYKPYDIVSVIHPPFNLVRRGWGEFSIRCILYFKKELDHQPVCVVHYLVLDKSYTGIETLGASTTIEIEMQNKNISYIRNKLEESSERLDLPSTSYQNESPSENNEMTSTDRQNIEHETIIHSQGMNFDIAL